MTGERIKKILHAARQATCDCGETTEDLPITNHKLTCTYRVTVIRMVHRLHTARELALENLVRGLINYPPPPSVQ